MSPHFSLFLGKSNCQSQRKGPSRLQSVTGAKANVMVCGCISVNIMGDLNMYKGTIDVESLELYRDIYCHQDDVFHGKSMVQVKIKLRRPVKTLDFFFSLYFSQLNKG